MGDYSAGLAKDRYPSIVAMQATEREIVLKLREYKQAVGEYLKMIGAADTPDAKRCPTTHPFPFYGAADGTTGRLAGPATACCSSGDIKTSGRWPQRHASLPGDGPSEAPQRHVGMAITPGQNNIYGEPGEPAECQKRCSRMPGCKAVVASQVAGKATCTYKTVAGPTVETAGATSFVMSDPRQCGGYGGGTHRSSAKRFTGENIVDAAPLATIATSDSGKCNLACTNNPKCVAFSIDGSANSCVLKSAAGPMVGAKKADPLIDDGTDPGAWGGTCQGMVDRFGYDGPGNPGCAPQAAIDWFNRHGCKSCVASCSEVRCGGCGFGCSGSDLAEVHAGGCSSRNQCACNADGNNGTSGCPIRVCGKEGRLIKNAAGVIAWVSMAGWKHTFTTEAWNSRAASCISQIPQGGVPAVTDGEWNALPTGTAMQNGQECTVTERKLVRPSSSASLAACGNPNAGAAGKANTLSAEPGQTWDGVCPYLADNFGMRPGSLGCAGSPDNAGAKKLRDIWNAWGCEGHAVTPAAPLTYAGCDARRHIDDVDSYILTSPKPCFDASGQLTGSLDWCPDEARDPGCSSPPCQPTGSLCPQDHPYPFTKNGVEDSGCCSSQEPVPGSASSPKKSEELPELVDPVALDSIGRPIPEEDTGGAASDLRKWDPTTGERRPLGHKRKAARAPPPPLPAVPVPPALRQPLPSFTQQAPLFEAFSAMGQRRCTGESVDCPDPPCRSGEATVERERAWRKVEKLNTELLSLVDEGQRQQESAIKKGVENVDETRGNTSKLLEVQSELKKEHRRIEKARRELDRTDTAAGGANLVPDMQWWRMVGYGLVLAVVAGVAIHVAIAGTVGTAEVVVGLAGAVLLAYYLWGWVAAHWTQLQGRGRAEMGFL